MLSILKLAVKWFMRAVLLMGALLCELPGKYPLVDVKENNTHHKGTYYYSKMIHNYLTYLELLYSLIFLKGYFVFISSEQPWDLTLENNKTIVLGVSENRPENRCNPLPCSPNDCP